MSRNRATSGSAVSSNRRSRGSKRMKEHGYKPVWLWFDASEYPHVLQAAQAVGQPVATWVRLIAVATAKAVSAETAPFSQNSGASADMSANAEEIFSVRTDRKRHRHDVHGESSRKERRHA